MAKYTLIHDIISEHSERIHNLRKYYPFFRLAETSFLQYKEGRYSQLDMGYLTMAVLRFFIEENNFQEKDVTYGEYAEFMEELLKRDFDLTIEEEEERNQLILYIFDKIRNEGKPFSFDYFDPADKKRKTVRMKLLDSTMRDQTIYYHISSEAIEFYLDTKEIKEESTISVEQLLLEKLIDSNNFKGAVQVVKRINNEVSRMQYRKNEVLQLLNENLKEGIKSYEEFIALGTRWFAQEQKLFVKNSELIQKALERTQAEGRNGGQNTQYYKTVEEIYDLELELKKAIQKHSELLKACTDLQIQADEMIYKARFKALRTGFDFKNALHLMQEQDNAGLLEAFIMPLLDLNRKKTFDLPMMDNLLTYKPESQETGEKIKTYEEETYIYEDEVEEARIAENYGYLLEELLKKIKGLGEEESFTLKELHQSLEERFGKAVFVNADYYSFLIHMCQKKEYRVGAVRKNPDTFFEEIFAAWLGDNSSFDELEFVLTMLPDEQIVLGKDLEITNIMFQKGAV